MRCITTALISLLAVGLTTAEELLDCGIARYYPSQYTCYDGSFLCPKITGEATLRCGDACYSPTLYTCNDGRLKILPDREGSFTLEAFNPAAPFHQDTIEACGRQFYIGLDAPCAYCPEIVPRSACPPGNITTLYPGSSLAVWVPGGQQYYIEPNGELGFTQAHSLSYPPGSIFGVAAYEGGQFTYGGNRWMACPRADTSAQWQVFAELPDLSFDPSCIRFTALVKGLSRGTVGAWQYT